MERMKCGQCGNDKVRLRAKRIDSDRHSFSAIIATCTKCKGKTTFSISPAKITASGEDGTFCIGWA